MTDLRSSFSAAPGHVRSPALRHRAVRCAAASRRSISGLRRSPSPAGAPAHAAGRRSTAPCSPGALDRSAHSAPGHDPSPGAAGEIADGVDVVVVAQSGEFCESGDDEIRSRRRCCPLRAGRRWTSNALASPHRRWLPRASLFPGADSRCCRGRSRRQLPRSLSLGAERRIGGHRVAEDHPRGVWPTISRRHRPVKARCRDSGRHAAGSGPPPGDSAGTPPAPAAAMPMPAVRLPATGRPGHHMRNSRHDLVIAARATVPFHRSGAGHRPHHVLVAVGSGFGPAVDIAQPGAQPLRLRSVTPAARFSSWHGSQLRRAGIRCSRSRAERCNPGPGSGSRGPRQASAPAV